MCVLQGAASPERVISAQARQPRSGHYYAGGDAAALPSHRQGLRPQPHAAGRELRGKGPRGG